MKYILIFWLSITAFDAYGQEKEPVKKRLVESESLLCRPNRRGFCLCTTTDEGNRHPADETRFDRIEREHRSVDGRCADFQFVDFRQTIRSRDALDGGIPRYVALTHAGDVERHAYQLADAGHDRLFDDSGLLHRRRLATARNIVSQRNGRRIRRCGETLHTTCRRRRLRIAIRAGGRIVQDLRRVSAPDLRRQTLASVDPRGLLLVGQRLQVSQLQQEDERLR